MHIWYSSVGNSRRQLLKVVSSVRPARHTSVTSLGHMPNRKEYTHIQNNLHTPIRVYIRPEVYIYTHLMERTYNKIMHKHTHTHTHIQMERITTAYGHIYVYIYMQACMYVCISNVCWDAHLMAHTCKEFMITNIKQSRSNSPEYLQYSC
jgi:hypothetical protein